MINRPISARLIQGDSVARGPKSDLLVL